MASLVQYDVDLAKAVMLWVRRPTPPNQAPPATLTDGDFLPIEFQTPPKMLSDGRSGDWRGGDLGGTEGVHAFATSGPRKMSLKWTYIVLGPESNWPISKIQRNVRAIRGYFALVRSADGDREPLVVRFRMWGIGGSNYMSCRIEDIDVKHGEAIVGNPLEAFPLRTDITIALRLWTNGESADSVPNQSLNELLPEDVEWY